MDNKHGFTISTRDRVFLMWQASMELVRDYEAYASETKDERINAIFERYAEDEGKHASELHSLLLEMEK